MLARAPSNRAATTPSSLLKRTGPAATRAAPRRAERAPGRALRAVPAGGEVPAREAAVVVAADRPGAEAAEREAPHRPVVRQPLLGLGAIGVGMAFADLPAPAPRRAAHVLPPRQAPAPPLDSRTTSSVARTTRLATSRSDSIAPRSSRVISRPHSSMGCLTLESG